LLAFLVVLLFLRCPASHYIYSPSTVVKLLQNIKHAWKDYADDF